MYFEKYKVNLSHWNYWKNWSQDITEKNAYLGLDFVREFATVYKEQTDAANGEYHIIKQGMLNTYNSEIEKINNDHRTRCDALESEKNAVFTTLGTENNKISAVMTKIKKLEDSNSAAASISDYVQMKEQREADLEEFKRLQDERKRIAVSLYEEKLKVENERYQNALSERSRQHENNIQVLENDYKTGTDRLEKEYRELFKSTVMSKDCFDTYNNRCNGYNHSLENYVCRKITPEYVYMGVLQMFVPKEAKTSLVMELVEELFGLHDRGVDSPLEIRLPYCQKVSDGVGVFIKDSKDTGMTVAFRQEHGRITFEDELSMMLLKTFMAFPAGKVEAFTIDTGRMGAVFHDMLVLGSRHKRIIEAASSRKEDIERTLSTLRSKVDGIANNYGDSFEARMKREPYYVLAISNFPEEFSEKALKDLSAIVKNAAACGVAVYILATETRLNNLSGENKIIADEIMQTIQYTIGNEGILKCSEKYIRGDVNVIMDGMYDYDKKIIESVTDTLREGINGYKAITTTFEDIYPDINDMNTWLKRDTTKGISIPIGIKGSSDVVNICMGAPGTNSEHHTLIEGSTGAGKSTFLHTMIMSTLISYSPSEVEMLLVDFKEGIEFKRYADFDIPSLKIVAIQSEREFGLQVFRELEKRLRERSETFKATGATSTEEYRKITNKPMPKIILLMDEYQELFVGSDDITKECEGILRTLVLQGRAYGIHIILATQNLNQADLDSEIYKQMVIRIALKGSKNVLTADNNGTEMLINSSDGTTIYNNNCGEASYNKVFQTAYMGTGDYQYELLKKISELQKSIIQFGYEGSGIPNKVLYTNFEHNSRHKLNKFMNEGSSPEALSSANERVYGLFLGETYDLEGQLTIGLLNQPGSNLFVSVPQTQLSKVLTNSVLSVLYDDLACKDATKGNRLVHFVNMAGYEVGKEIERLEILFPEYIKYAVPDGANNDWAVVANGYESVKEIIDNTYDELLKRRGGSYNPDDRIVFVVAGMEKIEVLVNLNAYERQAVDEYAIDDIGRAAEKNTVEKIVEIIKEGPVVGINSIMSSSDIEATARLFGNRFYDDFALRIAQQLSEKEMEELVREYHSDTVRPNTLVFLNKISTSNKKFRAYEIPGEEWMKAFADRYRSYVGGEQ